MTKKHRVVVIALGGNALIMEGQRGTIAEQFENTRKSLDGIVYCLKTRVWSSHYSWEWAAGGQYVTYGGGQSESGT